MPLDSANVAALNGLPVTVRVRTIVDLLRVSNRMVARDLLDRAVVQSWIGPADLAGALSREPFRTGNQQLRDLLDDLQPGAEAESERRLQSLLRAAGLRGWRAQYRIRFGNGSYALADVAFVKARLVIEVDGRRVHGAGSGRFESDRFRQNQLMKLGWRVLRFTWHMLVEQPDYVISTIQSMVSEPIAQDSA